MVQSEWPEDTIRSLQLSEFDERFRPRLRGTKAGSPGGAPQLQSDRRPPWKIIHRHGNQYRIRCIGRPRNSDKSDDISAVDSVTSVKPRDGHGPPDGPRSAGHRGIDYRAVRLLTPLSQVLDLLGFQPVQCAATAKPNELCCRSPSRRVVLLQVSSRWGPIDSLVPVTTAKHHSATEPLLLVHWKSSLIPEWNRQLLNISQQAKL